ncbi:amino acid ABC transporter ATP-binding protein [Thermanaerovibrio acidaminovorans]|jgi:polar amino acid transport system ATP-binding protein|uniref:ABC transporter related protein n=1 Tax=Thermanaerovibrio acidaminovorans (strain ATCC 49978 / DSM 6589 / Su883) TaxID=525903 RepID=D1B958_THEAS|nr:amino acid ABC transporter ATP-binding protein [Thermanaerovibrio acidaminovorans]ACZ18811.1 ABC transporter related protein [Thermanaerovibrio acidaminovorans DSM 6589]
MNQKAQPLVMVENLCKGFEDGEVLRNVSLTIREGDLVSIIGPSGCGKSTLLRCLNCLEIMDSGRLTVCGHTLERDGTEKGYGKETLAKAHEIRKEVGMVFQSFTLFPHKTVLENVMLAPMVVKKEPREAAEARAVELLRKVGLGDRINRYPSTLSGGQTQRAAIARALAMSPRVMLYDEPTSALDPELVGEVLQVMKDLDAEGMTQIIVTHEMRFAREASDYVVFMDKGEIVEIDDGEVLFTNPRNDRTREFLRHLVGEGV